MTFIISSILLLVSGVYYPIDVLPGWMQVLSKPVAGDLRAGGDARGIARRHGHRRSAAQDAADAVIGLITVPLGLAIFGYFERYAKRTGRLKRSG